MLYYKESGNKKSTTIVFLHAIGTSNWMWEEIVDGLQDFHCVCIDLPGHGSSANIGWISLTHSSSLILEVVNQVSPHQKIHLVGLSFGAYNGITFASIYPEKIESAYFSGLNILPLPYNKTLIKTIGGLLLPFIKWNIFININAKMLNIPDKHLENYRKSFLLFNKKSFWKASLELMDFKLSDEIKKNQTRKLFIAGGKEHPLVLNSLYKAQKELLNSRSFKIENCMHGWSGERPDIFTKAVKAWVLDKPLPNELLPIDPTLEC